MVLVGIAHRDKEIRWTVNLRKNKATMQQRRQCRGQARNYYSVVVYKEETISGSSGTRRKSRVAKVWKARQYDLE